VSEPIVLSPDGTDLGPLRPGDGVVWGQACAEPVPLVDRLLARAGELAPLRAFVGLGLRDLTPQLSDDVEVVSYGALGRLGRIPGLRVVPSHYSALPRLFARGRLPGDVVLVQVSPPDADGNCSYGLTAEYVQDAVAHARVVVAEVNDRCPRTGGATIPWSRLDAVLHTSRSPLEMAVGAPGEVEQAIAGHVAGLVRDGDTLQLGVGALPEAILRALHGHADLGVHSGMITDGILDLMDAGVVTNARKPSGAGVTVTGAALGTRRLFDGLDGREDVHMAPTSHTHDAAVLRGVGPIVAINSVLEIDLSGAANAEAIGPKRIGAVGGQVDFLRAAAASGGTPIVALPGKRIVSALHGPTSTARSDVDWVVTEHGARSLAGLTDEARRAALLELAGPERAEELAAEAHA
jgi:acyl-CoA hydrolase